jgi:hypothetical protein
VKEYNIPLVDEKIKGDIQFVLDKYDVEKRSHWAEFVAAYGNYFDPIID